jgi:colanic acid biosynthesis glycosyl transferase WcaI
MRAKVIFANRYFYPDLSASSQILSDLAQRLARDGIEVHVVCSRQLYENPAARLAARALVGNVRVHRVWTASFGRNRLIGRACDYLGFYLTAAARLFRLARRGDVLVMKTDPPLLSVLGALIASARGVILVNWLQDIFPEVAVRLYPGSIPGWIVRLLQQVRDRSLTAARVNVVLGPRMSDYLVSRGIERGRMRIIDNWADGDALRPKPASQSQLRRSLGLQDHFVIAYSGNLGRAHEFDTLVEAAEELKSDPRFAFLIIGGGAKMAALQQCVTARRLHGFRFLPYQPREALSDSLGAADVHLLSLLTALEGFIVPSKLYGILAAGRAAIFVGDRDGDVARVLRRARCGLSVECGDGTGLAQVLRTLKDDRTQTQAMGERARLLFESAYTLAAAADKWLDLLAESGIQSAARALPSWERSEEALSISSR